MNTTTTASEDLTRDELYERAAKADIEGRSDMTKKELVEALRLNDLGPNALDLLLRQHDEFRARFEEFRGLSSRPSKRKEQLVGELTVDLVKHAMIEEQVFYPAARNEVPDVEDDIAEDLEEHHVVDLLLAELQSMTSDEDRYDAKVQVLIENTEHHLEEEEEDLFPKVREALPEERLREIGAGMQELWETAPSLPHTRAPKTPPSNVLLSLPMAIWDLGRGLVKAVLRR